MKKSKGNGLINFIVVIVIALAVEIGAIHYMGVDIRTVFAQNKSAEPEQYMVVQQNSIKDNLTEGNYIQTSGSSGKLKKNT